MEAPLSRAPTRLRDSPNSPEFEFWNLGCNPSPPTLHSADELFSGGFLLPLHLLPPPSSEPDPEPGPDPSPSVVTSSTGNPILTASKRWKDRIFKRGENKKHNDDHHDEKSTDRIKREKRGLKNNNSAELNINIWPFSRSRSAGNNTVRSRPAGRKVSSAPCSRSNSSGSRRSMPSPGRTGVHLGRTSPVWQVRRNRTGPGSDEARRSKPVGKGRVLNLNVPICVGYRQQLSCRIDEKAAVGCSRGGPGVGGVSGGEGRNSGGGGGGNGNLFSLRGLFGKKGVLTA